ncbi:MAG: hypothetical protein R3A52_18280 [Polyangiales bacterium]
MEMSEAAAIQAPTVKGALFPRLGSVLALAPLGVWTVWHMWENLYAWAGEDAWARRVTNVTVEGNTPRYIGNPVSSALVSFVVFAPLIIHVLWGLRRLKFTGVNAQQYSYFGNFKYLLQRLSALGLLGFIGAHVFLARISPALNNAETGHESFTDLAAHMRHHPPTLIVYILGVLGTAYHLANGVYTSAFINGLAASPKAQRRMSAASIVFFLLLLGIGWGAVAGLWTAGVNYPPPLD